MIAEYEITGVSPVLMNNPASMQMVDNEKISKGKKNYDPVIEAAAKVYKNERGELVLPAMMFRSSLINGSVGQKIGKFAARKKLASAVFNTEVLDCVLFNGSEKPLKDYEIFTVRAVIQGNGVMRSRPLVRNWRCVLPLEVDTDFVSLSHVLEFLNFAGKTTGVGDWRPQKMGPYGRYTAKCLSEEE